MTDKLLTFDVSQDVPDPAASEDWIKTPENIASEMKLHDALKQKNAAKKKKSAIEASEAAKQGPGKGWWGPQKGGTHGSGIQTAASMKGNIQTAMPGIPSQHIDSLGGITTDAPTDPPLAVDEWGTFGYLQRDGSVSDSAIQGMYDPKTRIVHLAPAVVKDEAVRNFVLAHEIGHHVALTKNIPEPDRDILWAMRDQLVAGAQSVGGIFHRPDPYATAAKVGLRPVSFMFGSEFLADVYSVFTQGTDEQKSGLTALMKANGFTDIDITTLMEVVANRQVGTIFEER